MHNSHLNGNGLEAIKKTTKKTLISDKHNKDKSSDEEEDDDDLTLEAKTVEITSVKPGKSSFYTAIHVYLFYK